MKKSSKKSSKAKRQKAAADQKTSGRFRWLKRTAWGLAFMTLAVIAAVAWLARDLPDVDRIRALDSEQPIEVLAADGSLIARYGQAPGQWLNFEDIPPSMVAAILAIEDRRFFDHPGFDSWGILRAAIANLMAGDIRQGGSTITQQLAKNLFLTNERSFKRKLKELILALQLEARYSKEEILALYLNRVYMGAGAYGIDAAARQYFGHSARQLSVAEAAMLAGLVKAPSRLAPTHDPIAAEARAELVLAAMREAEMISLADEQIARAQGAILNIREEHLGARYFADWVAAEARAKIGAMHGPLSIRTSLDLHLQALAEQAIAAQLDANGAAVQVGEAAMVVMGHDGAVKAMVGGRDYTHSMFNRAVMAKRQPGSAFKPVVYLTALEAGLTPETRMRDSAVQFDDWTPKNFSDAYQGMVTLEQAFAQSINTVAVKLSEMVDRRRVIAMARRLGFAGDITPHPSIALGTSSVTPLELASAYAAIANGGMAAPAYAVTEIHVDGQLIYRRHDEPTPRVLAQSHAVQMERLLVSALKQGTGRAADPGRAAAGKTGTSQDYRDAWFVGYTTELVAALWLGNDDNSPMNAVTGGSLPARIWRDFIIAAHDGHPDLPLLSQGPGSTIVQATPISTPTEDEKKRGFWQRLFGSKKR